jgi:hypothetical protein
MNYKWHLSMKGLAFRFVCPFLSTLLACALIAFTSSAAAYADPPKSLRQDPCAGAAQQQAYLGKPPYNAWAFDAIARLWSACAYTYAGAGGCAANVSAATDYDRTLELYRRNGAKTPNDAIQVLDTLMRDYDVYVDLAIGCGPRWASRRDALRAEIGKALQEVRFP